MYISTRYWTARDGTGRITATDGNGHKHVLVCAAMQAGQLPKYPEYEAAARALAVAVNPGSDVRLTDGPAYTFAVITQGG
jgi:hypothetical protein